jgi:hypothetical protein
MALIAVRVLMTAAMQLAEKGHSRGKKEKSISGVAYNPVNGDEKLTGVYSTQKKADESIKRLTKQPGFKSHPEGFEVSTYDLDKDEWTEGFIPSTEAYA